MEIVFEGARSERETAERLNQFFVKSVETIHRNIPPAQVEPAVVPAEVRLNEDGSEDLLTELQPITLTKLKETVYSLKDCAGVDSVTKRVMTDSFDVVGEQLLAIVNRSLESGEFPQPWKRTLVIPIPKVPKSTRPEDHRPINILPLYEKVLETIVKEQLLAFVDRTKVLLEEQSGFRKHHSCESALNLLLLKWKQAIEEGKIVLSVFVDLKRAFETIDRTKLKAVLRRYGVRGSALKWFSSYLDSRTQVTRYNGSTSAATAVDLGVPQGSVLDRFSLFYISTT